MMNDKRKGVIMADLHINQNKGWQYRWIQEEDDIIRRYYSIKGYDELEKMLPNRSKKAIQSRAFKLGVKFLSYNSGYFNEIDSPTKAYWLGFLYADGYTTNDDRWGLELMVSDKPHMQNLLNEIEYTGNIKDRKRNNTETCSFLIKNKTMTNSLVSKGIVPRKTEVLEFPSEDTLNPIYYKDFIRGFFDGDGCVFYQIRTIPRKDRNNKIYDKLSKEVSFCCKSEKFINKLNDILLENDIYFNSSTDTKHNNFHYIRTAKLDTIKKFFDFIYEDSVEENRLKRKYNKFISLLEGRCA